MDRPIQMPQPVSAAATIQPVVAALSNQTAGGAPNPLSAIPAGTIVEGFVINRDAQNNPIVRTAAGDLKVTSEVFLKTGSEVVFRVDTTQPSLARILSVDGLTPEVYSAQNASRALTGDTISATGLQSASLASATAGTKPQAATSGPPILQAIVLQPVPSAAGGKAGLAPAPALLLGQATATSHNPSAAQLASVRTGAGLRLTLLDLKLPPLPVALSALPAGNKISTLLPGQAGASQPPAAAQPMPTGAPARSAARTPASGGPQVGPAPIAARAPLAPSVATTSPVYDELAPLQQALMQHEQLREAVQAARVMQRLNPSDLVAHYQSSTAPAAHSTEERAAEASSAKPAAPSTSRGPVVTASVIGHDAEGANILHTSFASLKLYTTQPLPTGTTLVVEVKHEDGSAPGAIAPDSETADASESGIARGLPKGDALEEAVRWLFVNQPDVARDLRERLPSPNHKLLSDMLFFIAMLKGGDVATLLGARAVRTLEQQAPAILSRARQQLSSAQESLAATGAPGWMNLMLPLVHGQEVHSVKLFIQRDPGQEKGTKDSGTGQRFVLEVELSALGPMQLDGFVRKADGRQNFDLMVRTEKPLDEPISQGIRTIFIDALAATRLAGQVVFQVGGQHFFRPAPRPQALPPAEGMQPILA